LDAWRPLPFALGAGREFGFGFAVSAAGFGGAAFGDWGAGPDLPDWAAGRALGGIALALFTGFAGVLLPDPEGTALPVVSMTASGWL
jgi:hypothetical protein